MRIGLVGLGIGQPLLGVRHSFGGGLQLGSVRFLMLPRWRAEMEQLPTPSATTVAPEALHEADDEDAGQVADGGEAPADGDPCGDDRGGGDEPAGGVRADP
jgi:hypothetical protein